MKRTLIYINLRFVAILFCFTLSISCFPVFGQAPVLKWVGLLEDHDYGNCPGDIDVDTSGNIYTLGSFTGLVDFDPGPDSFLLAPPSYYGIYICKLDSLKNFIWARGFQLQKGMYECYALSVCPSGEVLFTGIFDSKTDFDPGVDTFYMTPAGNSDIFVCKLDAQGNFLWAKQFGNSNYEYGSSITQDINGNIFITGGFKGTTDLDPGPDTCKLTAVDEYDIFICKLDPNGTFAWAKSMGGPGSEFATDLVSDLSGNIFLCGYFYDFLDFDTGSGTDSLVGNLQSYSTFFCKYDGNGDFKWAKCLGGTGNVNAYGITVDPFSNIYLTGQYLGQTDLDPGPGVYSVPILGNAWAFLCKFDTAGNLTWARVFGGHEYTMVGSVRTDQAGNPYTFGIYTDFVEFDDGSGSFNLHSQYNGDPFFCKFSASGDFEWVGAFEGMSEDRIYAIAMDAKNNLYFTGRYLGPTDFDPGLGTNIINRNTYGDTYIVKLHESDSTGDLSIIEEAAVETLIYPNPSTGRFNLVMPQSLSGLTIMVQNPIGQLIKEVKNMSGREITIDLTDQPEGLYFIIFNAENDIQIQKVLKL